MDKTQQFMIELLSAAIRSKEYEKTVDAVDWNELLRLAEEHLVVPLLYPVVKKYVTDRELLERWRRYSIESAIRQKKFIEDIHDILLSFNDENIDVIALKGLVIRNYYPHPELRSMSDVDLLIRENDIRTVEDCLERKGYYRAGEDEKHIIFSQKSKPTIEIHTKLSKEFSGDKIRKWEESLWDHTSNININGVLIKTLSLEDHLLYICVHMANHVLTTGFGLRQLCDLTVFVEENLNKLDWNRFYKMAEELGIRRYTIILFELCRRLYDLQGVEKHNLTEEDYANIELLLQDIISGGIFGCSSAERIVSGSYNVFLGNKTKSELVSRKKRLLYLIFPSYKHMKVRYKYIRIFPFLLPTAWILRIVRNLFKRKWILSSKHAISKSQLIYEQRYRLLKWLNLI